MTGEAISRHDHAAHVDQGNAASLLTMRGVRAGYGGADVIASLDLTIARGEVVAILGRNGAGKTTLLHALFNLGPRVSGHIEVAGQAVTGWPTHRIARLGLALVPQGRGVFAPLTVQESLSLATLAPARAAARRWTLQRVYDEFPRLAEKRRTPSGALSGGERQMLALARALLTEPDVLLLDEPSEGLSPRAVEEVLVHRLQDLARGGLTIVLVEQNLSLALRVACRVVVLAHGAIGYDGSAAQLAVDRDTQHRLLGV